MKGLYRVEEFKEDVDLIQGLEQRQHPGCDLFCKMFSLKKIDKGCAEFCVNSYHWM